MNRSLREDILRLLAVSIRANKKALEELRGNTPYLWKTLSEMKGEGLVSSSKTDMWTVRLTAKGVAELNQIDERLCDYYLYYSCDNKPGSTLAHKRAQCKASEIVALLSRMGIKVGVEKPGREVNGERRLGEGQSALYLMKELKFEKEQKVTRAQISRASGIVLSDAVDALIYNTQDKVIRLNGGAEKATKGQILALRSDVFNKEAQQKSNQKYSLVVGYSYDLVGALFYGDEVDGGKSKDGKRKKKNICDAIHDKTVTATDILYFPMTDEGRMLLRLLLSCEEEAIVNSLFSTDTKVFMGKDKMWDAEVKGLYCYETFTMNLSKLARVKLFHGNELHKIGFVCTEAQIPFICNILERSQSELNLRVIGNERIRQVVNSLSNRGG